MMPALIYVRRLIELRRSLYEAETEDQFRTRWTLYNIVRTNALSAHPNLHL